MTAKKPKRVPKIGGQVPTVGDKVGRVGSEFTYEVTNVNPDATEVNLRLEGTTEVERFRVPISEIVLRPKKK